MTRSYKWQPHDGARHALPRSLAEGDPGSTLCGIEVTAKSDEWPEAERYWPTCNACDLAWRLEEQILPWPRDGKLTMTEPARIKELIAPVEDALHGA